MGKSSAKSGAAEGASAEGSNKQQKLNNGWNTRLQDVLRPHYPAENKRRIDCARLAFDLGVAKKTVEHWLDGEREINFTNLIKLQHLTGMCIHWVLTGKGPALAKNR